MRRRIIQKESVLKVRPTSKKILLCSRCQTIEVEVYEDIESIICHVCCVHMGPSIVERSHEEKAETRKLKGWKFMKIFVDKDGNVFHKGIEQPTLKGSLAPTIAKPKKSKFEREQEKFKKETRLAERHARKLEKVKLHEEKKQQKIEEQLSDV